MKDITEPRSAADRYDLGSGVGMPVVALGTAGLDNNSRTVEIVKAALKLGYRHFDTAAAYGNEEAVGRGIREGGVPREEIFLTTKLDNDAHGYDAARRAFEESLSCLGLDYVDLYLIHWPNPPRYRENWQEANSRTWEAFEEFYDQKTARSVGVSNFRRHHLDALAENARVRPMVNQIKLCPGVTQDDVVAASREYGLQITAYSPLDHGRLLKAPELREMASKYGKTPAQVALRWSLEMGFVPLPKSSNEDRLKENLALFDFALEDKDRDTLTHLKGYASPPSDPDAN